MLNIRAFLRGLRILPVATSGIDSMGELEVQSADGQLYYHDGTGIAQVVTTTSGGSISGVTIDGDTNNVIDLSLTSLKTNLTDANNFLVRNGSGVVVSNTKVVPTGTVVGTTDAQVLTLKDIDGGTATNTSRFTIPKAAKATLDALTRKQGTIVYASDEDAVYVDNGTILVGVTAGITALTGEATASGSGSVAITLSNAAVIGKVLTGFVSGAGTVAATDTILQAFNKINGNVAVINAYAPVVSAIPSTVIDWSLTVKAGGIYTKTLGANTTFTFSNIVAGQTIVVRLTNTVSNYTVTWPTVKWTGGIAPVMTVGAKDDVYTFISDGVSIYGAYVQDMS